MSPARRPDPDDPRPPSFRQLGGDRRTISDVTRRAVLRTIGFALVVVAGLSAYVAAQELPRDADGERIGRMTATSCAYDTRADPGRDHVDAPMYLTMPPSGGPHLATPAPAGVAEGDAVPELGAVVHALEHGLVAIWVDPADATAHNALRAVATEFPRDVLLVPLAGAPDGGAATSWGRRLLCERVDPGAVRLFVQTFRGRGPERIRAADGSE